MNSIARALKSFDNSMKVSGLTLFVTNDEIELTLADIEIDNSEIIADLDLACARLALSA